MAGMALPRPVAHSSRWMAPPRNNQAQVSPGSKFHLKSWVRPTLEDKRATTTTASTRSQIREFWVVHEAAIMKKKGSHVERASSDFD